MKVGIETQRLHGPPSGPRTYRRRLCEALLERDENVELRCFQFSGSDHELFGHPRVEFVVVPSMPGLLERRLDSLGVDIIHLGAGLHRYPFLWRMTTPIVATIHGIEPLVLNEHGIPPRVRIQKKHIWPQIARFLDHIVVVSESAKRQLLDHYPVPPERVSAIYNGIDHNHYQPQPYVKIEIVLETHGVDLPYFLTVSGYSKRKNPETLVAAFEHVADRLPEYSLVVAGPGWDDAEVDDLLGGSGYAGRIRRLGTVAREDLPSLYSGATCLIAPTRHENFGLTLVEAMACGTPVVASNVYAVPEATGNAAILVDDPDDVEGFASAMERLATDQRLRDEHHDVGLQQASRFTWERCARDILDLYRSVT